MVFSGKGMRKSLKPVRIASLWANIRLWDLQNISGCGKYLTIMLSKWLLILNA